MKTIKKYIVLIVIILIQLGINLYLGYGYFNSSETIHTVSKQAKKGNDKKVDSVASTSTGRVHGCDLSHWNGEVNWSELKKDNIHFVYIKATQGNTYIDPAFEYNWNSAKTYGMIRGAYHFYQPGIPPEEQAEHFINTIQPEKGDLLPVLDIEIHDQEDAEQLTKDVKIWVDKVYQILGRYPMIYTDYGFWNQSIDKPFGHCPLWIAEWDNGRPPVLPNGWKKYDFWQYSDAGTVKGVPTPGKVDLDYFNGGMEGLKLYQIR